MAATLGNATVNVLARTVLFEQSLKRSLKRMSLLTAGIFAGVGAANFFGSAIKDATSLELRVARIKTLMEGVDEARQAAFDAAPIRAFSNEIGLSADKVAESIYYMIGSGVALRDAYGAVRAASNVAIATNTDLKFSSDFVSTALNAMGGQVDKLTGQVLDSAHATDIFFAALAEGKGEPRELAQFISTAVPAAKGLAVSYGEVNAAMAAGTLLGTKARKVTTGLSYIMRGLGNEGKGVGKAFKEITGTGFADWAKKAENEGNSLQKAIKILGTEVGLGKISNIGGAETGLEAIKLLLTVWPQYVAIQKEVAGASGDADRAVEKVNKTLSRQVDILKNKFKNFRGSVGDWLGPVLYDALAKVQAVWPAFKEAFLTLVAIVGDAFTRIKEVLGPVIGEIKNALSQIDWGAVLSILQAAVTGIMAGLTPLFALVYALFGLFAAGANYIQPVVDILNNMKPVIIGITAAFVAYKTAVVLTWAAQKAMVVWTAALSVAMGIQTLIAGGLTGAMLSLNIMMAANPVGLVVAAIIGLGAAFIYAWKKSETFRKVVAGVLNTIVTVTITAVKAWLNIWLGTFQLIAEGFDQTFGRLARILGINLGDMSQKVEQFRNNVNGFLDGIKNQVHITVTANADQAMAELAALRQAYLAATGKNFIGPIPTGTTFEDGRFNYPGASDDTIDLGGSVDTGASGAFGGNGFTPSSGGGGGGGAKAVSEAAKKVKAALKSAFADLERIAKNTSKQSVDTLKENFRQLYADLGEAGRKDVIKFAQSQEKALIKAAGKSNKVLGKILKTYKADSLVDLAIARDKVSDKLDLAKDKLKEITDASKEFTNAIKAQVNTMGNVADESKGLGTTYTGIRNQLRGAIAQTKQFTVYVDKLRKMKLNETSLRQIIDAGPEAGMAAAKALVQSGQAGVDQIDKLQAQLTTAGNSLATSANNQFYAAGIKSAEGIVKGLQSQEAAIVKAMDSIADKLVASIKKKLGIKSPSVVFGEIGENISKGMAGGIENKAGLATKAAEKMTSQVVFGAGAVQVNGVSDPFAARRAGILSGEGIANVLDRRRTAAALDQ